MECWRHGEGPGDRASVPSRPGAAAGGAREAPRAECSMRRSAAVKSAPSTLLDGYGSAVSGDLRIRRDVVRTWANPTSSRGEPALVRSARREPSWWVERLRWCRGDCAIAQAGVDPRKVSAALMGGFAQRRVIEVHGERMITGTGSRLQASSVRRIWALP